MTTPGSNSSGPQDPLRRRISHATIRVAAACLTAIALLAIAGCTIPTSSAEQGTSRLKEAIKLSEQADAARKAGKTDEAIDLYKQAIGLDKDLYGAWNNLGTMLMEKGQYLPASDALKTAAGLAPGDPRPLENLGLVYHRAGWDAEALRYFRQALERDPTRVESLRGMAVCAQRLNAADDDLLDDLRRALLVETDPQWRSMISREKFRVETALDAAKKAERQQ